MDNTGRLLISRLESSDHTGLHDSFVAHLRPLFSVFGYDPRVAYKLSEKFYPFVRHALSLLHEHLSKPTVLVGDEPTADESDELFKCYRLCLDRLYFMAHMLCPDETRLLHCDRVSMFQLLVRWQRFEEAEFESLAFLESLKPCPKGEGYLPCLGSMKDGELLADLVLRVVEVLFSCAASLAGKDNGERYSRVLTILVESRRIAKTNKSRRLLVQHVCNIIIFLVEDLQLTDQGLVANLLRETLFEFCGTTWENEVFQFACRVCLSLFQHKDGAILWMIVFVLETVALRCKVSNMLEFMKLVAVCANNCVTNTVDTSSSDAVAKQLQKLSVDSRIPPPFGNILALYASGVFMRSHGTEGIYEEESSMVHELVTYVGKQEKNLHLTQCVSAALGFVSKQLSELVNAERDRILSKCGDFSFSNGFCNIQNIFNEFLTISLSFYRSGNGTDECDMTKTLLNVAVAAYTLALRTKLDMQEVHPIYYQRSEEFIRHLVSSGWIDLQGLKCLFSSIYSIGMALHGMSNK